ncbi:hypothetical protein PAMP_004249 [Pampus punctatissimus]
MAGTALKRLMAEYKRPANEENFFEWEALIMGPQDTCFEGGVFPAVLSFPSDYPLSPPKMRFTCDMFHPNIYPDGRVCISILHAPGDDPMGYESSAERWSPVQSVEKILLSVVSMLAEPNDESGANVDASKMWREDRDQFYKLAQKIVQMVQSGGSRGLRLAGAVPTALSFPASQIFTNCDYFPAEFSLVTTIKIPRLRQKRNEYIFAMVEEEADSLVLGLRASENRLHLLSTSPGTGGRSRLSFKEVGLDDNRWHTMVLAITGPYATLTIDCGPPLELKQVRTFPSALSTRGSRFFIGSRRRWRGRFSGLMRQLVLLPGSDATPRVCPTSDPSLADLSVPQVLKSTPFQPDHHEPDYPYGVAWEEAPLMYETFKNKGITTLQHLLEPAGAHLDNAAILAQRLEVRSVRVIGLVLDSFRKALSKAEARVTLGNPPPCSRAEQGQLWFNAQRKGLFICDGFTWRTLLMNQERLDYVEDYQDLYTSSETFDVEVFSIPSEGLFMAAANRDSRPGSGIYKWTDGSFHLYQNISTQEARAWKHFTIDDKIFLVVANSREVEPELSVIYRWNQRRQRFLRHQTLETHAALDWEAFHMYNHSFLVVANHRRGKQKVETRDSNHNIYSVLYRWNPNTKLFEVNQTLSTSGAYDWEFFTVGPYHFLVVANTFDGQTTTISSTVYVWLDGCFQTFQNIPHHLQDKLSSSCCIQAAVLRADKHDDYHYGSDMTTSNHKPHKLKHTVAGKHCTVGATDWETFQIDGRFFLAVANSQKVSERSPSVYSINSTVYELNALTQTFIRFQDILTHSAVDWEFFTIGEEKFLVVANSHDGSSYSLNSVIYRWQGYEGFVAVHSLPTFGCRDWEHFSTDEGSFLMYSSATSRLSKVFKLRTY